MKATIHRWMIAITTLLIIFIMGTESTYAKTSIELEQDFKILDERREKTLKQCQGEFKNKRPMPKVLETVIYNHMVWRLNTEKVPSDPDPRMANLCGAILDDVNLSGAWLLDANLSGASLFNTNLSKANLNGVNLSGAWLLSTNLSGAWLLNANLSGAILTYANLSGASLDNANLSGTNLGGANLNKASLTTANLSNSILLDTNLSGANLTSANLSGASLTNANLSGALLVNTDLSKANLSKANMRGVLFEPKDIPDIDSIAYVYNLSEMVFSRNPQALVKLRKALKEAGFRQKERMVTYAIEHTTTINMLYKGALLSLVEGVFRYVLFDLTTQWGMVPGRALLILLALIPIFAIPYVITLRLQCQDGIWCKWTDDRVRLDLGTKRPKRLHVGWHQAPTLGFYFSVLSSFNIGWRELNVGNWIQRLQAKEYTLKATGWVRTVSGVQSLISAYLLAIWALTYFGRPFE